MVSFKYIGLLKTYSKYNPKQVYQAIITPLSDKRLNQVGFKFQLPLSHWDSCYTETLVILFI